MHAGFDTNNVPPKGIAERMTAAGYSAIGLYMRRDRVTTEIINELLGAGIGIFWFHERGYPTSADYFSAAQGAADAQFVLAEAQFLGVSNFAIANCVDYDAASQDIEGCVLDDQTSFHNALKPHGIICGVYGSGDVCMAMIAAGVAHYGILSQSTGFPGYDEFRPHAAAVQGIVEGGVILGLEADPDEVMDDSILMTS